MSKSNFIGGVIVGAAAALTIYRLYSMTQEERDQLLEDIKSKTTELLDNAETTVEKLEQHIVHFKQDHERGWIDKLLVLKKMFTDLYGQDTMKKTLSS